MGKVFTDEQKTMILERIKDELDEKLDIPETAGTNGQVLTSDGQGGQSWQTPAADAVSDVQLNGSSIIVNGVANIPKADMVHYGVVKTGGSDYGIGAMVGGGNDGRLYIESAPASVIKNATSPYRPITPNGQHVSVFYGLAKAAGDTTQAQSDNAVGTYTADAKAAIQTMLDVPSTSDIPTVPVQDVQVGGSSILVNGVANLPVVTPSGSVSLGLVKPATGLGTGIANNGGLAVIKATENQVKTGLNEYNPIVPQRQHVSTFYGLAKAAGVDLASGSDTVGAYPNAAKAAICNMIGAHTIVDEAVSGTDPVITGEANHRYTCGEVYTLSITPPVSGTMDVIFTSGTTATMLTLSSGIKMPDWFDATALETERIYEILITEGMYGSVQSWAL